MAEPVIINASTDPTGMSMESPPVFGSSWPSGIVSRMTPSLVEVLSPVVGAPVVLGDPVLAPVVSSLVVVPVGAPVVRVVPVVLVPVVVPVVVPLVAPVVLVPVVVPVVPVVVPLQSSTVTV
jgi:hypothetical protein